MSKVSAYIDAYNLYHSLQENNYKRFYWLDISLLIKRFIKENDSIVKIYYFTSASPNPKSQERQKTYIDAMVNNSLKNLINFQVVWGRFEPAPVKCNICHDFAFCKVCDEQLFFNHEKETDVNIGVQMLSDAYEGDIDTALLLTEDSDQVGTIKTIKKFFFDTIKVGVLFPPGRKSDHLANNADYYLHISQSDLGKCQLPDIVTKPNGHELKRPNEWQ
jgi:uncharacterized LabA/DUF88 family protein